MSDIVPFTFSQEQSLIKEEIAGKDLSVIFDGTTQLGEAMAILVRLLANSTTTYSVSADSSKHDRRAGV